MNTTRYSTPFGRSAYADSPRVLIVDHERRYLRLIEANLQAHDCETLTAQNAADALALAAQEALDLILLDSRLPDKRGDEVCRAIREFSSVPVIMLTARERVEDIVEALDAGADDCIPKPFNELELLARIRAVLRRISDRTIKPRGLLRGGDIQVDREKRRVFRNDEEIRLTPTEYELLVVLMENADKVMVPAHLLEGVWGYQHEMQPQLLWQAIHRLRQKIEPDPKHPTYVHTRRGIGYVFSPEG